MSTPENQRTKGSESRRRRKLQTRRSVKIIDRVSTVGITIGGVATILAVLAVFLFLVSVVVPIFLPGSADEVSRQSTDTNRSAPLSFGTDEYRVLGWAVFPDGWIRATRLDTGAPVDERRIFENKSLTAHAATLQGDRLAFGFSDGTIQVGLRRIRHRFSRPCFASRLGPVALPGPKGGLRGRGRRENARGPDPAAAVEGRLSSARRHRHDAKRRARRSPRQ